jgi:VIT1/CCC1 family predicted Fe2+/Mn2+ transporter
MGGAAVALTFMSICEWASAVGAVVPLAARRIGIDAAVASAPFITTLIDGAVTTFAIVSAVAGAQLSSKIVLVLGIANLLADGFSIAASNYLGTRTEHEVMQHLEGVEQQHIDTVPEGEREEVRQIFQQKGLAGDALDHVVEAITADRERWVRTMLSEEYDLPQAIRSPWLVAMSTFSAFVICGLSSLLPFFFGMAHTFWLTTALTGGVFFTIGSVKSRWSPAPWWRSGLSTLAIGLLAAGMAYGAGMLLKGLI